MAMLKILLLGPFQAKIGQEPIDGFESARVRALLAYLAVEADQPHSRDTLAGLLWPERSNKTARKNLRQALSNLRKAIGDHERQPPYLEITRETVQFSGSPDILDSAKFQNLIETVDRHPHRRVESCRYCAGSLQQAVDLYRGDFLQGFFLDGSAAFQDWMLLKRERFHRQAVQALTVLTGFYEQRGEYDLALRCAYPQVEMDPWRELGYQSLMRLLALKGERGAALKQYEKCKIILEEELGVPPSPDTERIYQQIQTNSQEIAQTIISPPILLPPQSTRFIGRDEELRRLLAGLGDARTRLLTLVGPGGVGKTRLALQAAREAAFDYLHGVCFVPLVSVASAEELPMAVANALGFTFHGREEPLDQLINYLRGKEILLVLDNVEHLLDDLDWVLKIIQQAPDVSLLITSREPLHVQAEQLFDLAGLRYSKSDSSQMSEALQLFRDRALRVRPDFTLDEKNLSHAARVCQMVAGMPLAIELAAALVRQWTCPEIAFEIQRSLDSLTSSMRDVPDRHRSLRATFERSWELLDAHEKGVLVKLAIFRGGFDLQAAQEIVGAQPADLTALMNKSLLRRNADGRFDLHPLIGQFLDEKLGQDSHQHQSALEKLSAYFARFLRGAESKLKSSQQPEFLERINQDFENIKSAWLFASENKALEQIDQSLEALYLFFEGRSRFRNGAALFEAALNGLDVDQVYGRLALRLGALSYRLGEYDKSQNLLEEGLQSSLRLGARQEEAFAYYALGNLSYLRGNFNLAVEQYQTSLEISQEERESYQASQALNGLGLALYMQGEYAQAQRHLQDTLEIHQQVGDPWGKAIRYNNLALIAHALGQYTDARDLYARSLEFWKVLHQEYGMASCFNNMGLVAEAVEELSEARRLYSHALKTFEILGHRYGMASCLNNLGNVAASLGEHGGARRYYQQALELRENLGDQRGVASVLNNLGRVADILEEFPASREHFIRALETGWGNNAIPVVLDSLLGLAELWLHCGSQAEAVKLLALVVSHAASNQESVARAEYLIASISKEIAGEDFDVLFASGEKLELDQIVAEILSTS
jgi:DNA-binding SARP family transcriptional activator/Tfp pilus assembly protein PilF